MNIKTTIFLLIAFLLPFHAQAAEKAAETGKTITMATTLGDVIIELYDAKAPITCENFRRYVNEHFYDGLTFHRVIPGFVIQAGGFEPGMKMRRPGHPPIKNEATNGLKNERGTLSMARTSMVDSATSQFFINLRDNVSLDHVGIAPQVYGYAVFGKVIKGLDVVDKIAAQPTTSKKRFRDVPVEDIVIEKAYEN